MRIASFVLTSCLVVVTLPVQANPLLEAPRAAIPGGVSSVSVPQAEGEIKDLNDELTRLRHTFNDLISECIRTQEVNVVNEDVDDPQMGGWGSGGMNNVYPGAYDPVWSVNTGRVLPPRKKLVDFDMSKVNDLERLITEDTAALTLPAKDEETLKPQMEVLHDSLKQIEIQRQALTKLTRNADDYDNAAIARVAQVARDDVRGMSDICKQIYKTIKK